jgi:hypothetical protein
MTEEPSITFPSLGELVTGYSATLAIPFIRKK